MADPVQPLVFQHGTYAVDSCKNLYTIAENQYTLICKLKKHIYLMVECNGITYFVDAYGDCYSVDSQIHFVCGVIGSPTFFAVCDHGIIICDSYSRLWIWNFDGSVKNILFVNQKISSIESSKDLILVMSDGKREVVDFSH